MKNKLALLVLLVAGATTNTACATGKSFAQAGVDETKTAGQIVTKVAEVGPTVFDLLGNLFQIIGGAIDDIHSITNPAKSVVGLPTSDEKPVPPASTPAPAPTPVVEPAK